ncbi:2,4-dichlorophenol 6-monooxygenase [Mycobacterium triplex]|uniref:2,4-dichlorophenol 6-monooxygenase n=1 Tax=Mycobacterium triplex TaxID=47839 RepID=A0ABX3VVR2_9MYCO|nr:FAD-dependent monooxygenase [Mycobacterium triplex]ORW99083.1 2,4-dichlorophenol 6-monooxygenase [Mycobacterium triplex]
MRTFETDVLVVGAGVTGLTASILLADHGVRTITIARHPGVAPQPRAHITNQRTVEVFRDVGIEERVRAVGVPLRTLNHNVLATSFTGMEILRYRSYGTGPRAAEYATASPCELVNAPQHVLEPVMLTTAVERGADVRFAHELVEIGQSPHAALARVRARASGEEYFVRAKYVIGADGGRSRVAEQLGIAFEGQAALKHMVNAWVEVDLAEYAAHRPGVIYTILQPGADSWVGSGAFICVRPFSDWVLMREYDPSQGEPDTSEAAVTQFTRTLIGDPSAQIRLKGTSKWQVNNVVAKEYRRGRVFLMGDAAHRHPPAGGLGSNTSIQDAYNLAWKLAYVLSGRAGEDLLDSYHEERQPVGKQIVDRAIQNLKNQAAAVEALGLRREQSPEEAWVSLNNLASDAPGAAEQREALAAAVALQNYRSNALGVELGQRYTSRAVIDDGTPFPEPTRDPVLHYQPTTHPGAYLPHAWVEHQRKKVSTLDLAGHGRFCLIVGIGGEPWAQAADKLSAELGIELPVYRVGYRCEYDDVLGDWAALREIDDRGALLVRPDRHIAWRCASRPKQTEDVLRAALHQALARTDEQKHKHGKKPDPTTHPATDAHATN